MRKETEDLLTLSEKKLRMLAQKLIYRHEKERERISKELHDSIGSSLIAVRYVMERKLREIGGKTCEKETGLDEILDMLNSIVDDTRRISKDLRPTALEHLGVASVVQSFCEDFQKSCSEPVSFKYDVELIEENIPEDMKLLLFRVVREGLANVSKHSSAGGIRLSLRETDGRVVFELEDNGRGFDVETAWMNSGLGLEIMKEIAEYFGGDLHVLSEPERGTRIHAQWPLQACKY